MAWVQHSFLLDVEDHDLLKQNFKGIAQFVASVNCYRLDYPRDFEILGQVMETIIFGTENIALRMPPICPNELNLSN